MNQGSAPAEQVAPGTPTLSEAIHQIVQVIRPTNQTHREIELSCHWLIAHPLDMARVLENRKTILARFREHMGSRKAAKEVTPNDLTVLLKLYDEVVFAALLKDMKKPVTDFCYEGVCEHKPLVAGRYHTDARITLFADVFEAIEPGKWRFANGVPCRGWDECMLVVFEHELVHALIASECPEERRGDTAVVTKGRKRLKSEALGDKYVSHPPAFMALADALFKHKTFQHRLAKKIG